MIFLFSWQNGTRMKILHIFYWTLKWTKLQTTSFLTDQYNPLFRQNLYKQVAKCQCTCKIYEVKQKLMHSRDKQFIKQW